MPTLLYLTMLNRVPCRAELRRGRRYLAQLLRTTPMESLLNRHVDMTTEIKTLDSDMQARSRP